MRKISKSRTDDDVVSSTNGSVVNEEHSTDAERQADPDEKEPESESTDNVEINESVTTSSIKESSKKGKAKNKTKKKKSEKKVTEEEYEVCDYFVHVCKQLFVVFIFLQKFDN